MSFLNNLESFINLNELEALGDCAWIITIKESDGTRVYYPRASLSLFVTNKKLYTYLYNQDMPNENSENYDILESMYFQNEMLKYANIEEAEYNKMLADFIG